MLVKLNAQDDPNHNPVHPRMHFGYECTLSPEGELFADVPDDLIPGEVDAGRVTLPTLP